MRRSRRKRSLLADKIMIEYNQEKKYEHFIETQKKRKLKGKSENESSDK